MKQLVPPIALALALLGAWWWMRPEVVRDPGGQDAFELVVRTTGDASAEALPMVLALHGNGDTPSDFFDSLLADVPRSARFVLLRAPLAASGGRVGGKAWPLEAAGVIETTDAIARIVPQLVQRYPTVGRPIVLGFSGGAVAAYGLVARHPELFSCALPLSGKLPDGVAPTQPVFDHRHVSVFAFHGKRDSVIGFGAGQRAVQTLEKLAVPTQLDVLEGEHLDVFRAGRAHMYERLGTCLSAAEQGGR